MYVFSLLLPLNLFYFLNLQNSKDGLANTSTFKAHMLEKTASL